MVNSSTPSSPIYLALFTFITDLTVQFDPESYSVNEGQVAELMLVLNRAADRDVMVDFTTVDDSAIGNKTYIIA